MEHVSAELELEASVRQIRRGEKLGKPGKN